MLIEQVVNIKVPTGGVAPAIVKFKIKTIPKCTGSIPYELVIGTRMGVSKINAAVPSTNIPNINKNKLIISNIAIGFDESSIMNSAKIIGIFSQVK